MTDEKQKLPDDGRMNVCYSTSNLYAKYLPVTIYSLLKHNKDVYIYIYSLKEKSILS
jgi:lipopolysaccharide biosynthesis glycosyltransferase